MPRSAFLKVSVTIYYDDYDVLEGRKDRTGRLREKPGVMLSVGNPALTE